MSRDRTVGDTFYIMFTTRAFATGIPTVLAGSPVISAYEDASLTQITAGITLGVDHDGVVGMNMLTIVATGGNTFESGKDYQLVITAGTVGGVSVVGEVVGQFSLGLSAAAKDLANGTDGLSALKTDSAAILVDTAVIGVAGAGLTDLGGMSTGMKAEVNAEADTALTDYDGPTNAEMIARTILSASYFDPATDTVVNVTNVATLTGHTAQTGDSFARLGAPAGASLSADVADLPTVAEFNARTLAAAGYFDPATDAVANVTLVATTTTNTDMRGTDSANTVVPPSVAQFNARTILSASYFDPAADTVALVTATTSVTNQVTANVTAISGDSAAADSLEASMETLVTGTATGTPTTTTMADSAITEVTDDHFIGRVIIWRTGALKQQATVITDYDGTTKLFTFTATTNAAASGDAYVIV